MGIRCRLVVGVASGLLVAVVLGVFETITMILIGAPHGIWDYTLVGAAAEGMLLGYLQGESST